MQTAPVERLPFAIRLSRKGVPRLLRWCRRPLELRRLEALRDLAGEPGRPALGLSGNEVYVGDGAVIKVFTSCRPRDLLIELSGIELFDSLALPGLRTPVPLGWAEWRGQPVLAMSRVPGVEGYVLYRERDPRLISLVEQCGKQVARLHRSGGQRVFAHGDLTLRNLFHISDSEIGWVDMASAHHSVSFWKRPLASRAMDLLSLTEGWSYLYLPEVRSPAEIRTLREAFWRGYDTNGGPGLTRTEWMARCIEFHSGVAQRLRGDHPLRDVLPDPELALEAARTRLESLGGELPEPVEAPAEAVEVPSLTGVR